LGQIKLHSIGGLEVPLTFFIKGCNKMENSLYSVLVFDINRKLLKQEHNLTYKEAIKVVNHEAKNAPFLGTHFYVVRDIAYIDKNKQLVWN
jgi:hypothetical protein